MTRPDADGMALAGGTFLMGTGDPDAAPGGGEGPVSPVACCRRARRGGAG